MLRRSLLEISSRKSVRRIPLQITTQVPAFLSLRKEFSSKSTQNVPQGAGSGGNKSDSGSSFSKVVFGSIALGTVVAVAAYQSGYLNHNIGQEKHSLYEPAFVESHSRNSMDVQHLKQHADSIHINESNMDKKGEHHGLKPEAKSEVSSYHTHLKDLSDSHGETQLQAQEDSNWATTADAVHLQEEELPNSSQTTLTSNEQSPDSIISSEEAVDLRDTEAKTGAEIEQEVPVFPVSVKASAIHEENEIKSMPSQHLTGDNAQQVMPDKVLELQSTLMDDYELKHEASVAGSSAGKDTDGHRKLFRKEGSASTVEDLDEAHISEDGKLVLDFLQAIHTAEKRQAELDAHVFAEERRTMKEKYENKLKDARARELMYAEEAAILDKELSKERMKANAAIKALQEKAEEKLRMELQEKEKEAELKLQKLQELAKAELTAAIASEKASHIEKMAEANLHINALCIAFYARSEEARQHHSVHKLALGALALEDTLSEGLPIQNEIEALQTYLEGADRGSLLDFVLLSLPKETQNSGTDTLLQLNLKFDALKGTLRHFSLIPPGGGGILAHSLAYLASLLKVKEADKSGDGIESVINRVEGCLAEGKLAEAADALEEGVKGSQAAEVISDWVRRARNRAITEQALTFLRSYATSISHT